MSDRNEVNYLKRFSKEPEKVADEIAHHVVDLIGKPEPIRRLRNSQIFSGVLGICGLALFIVGVERVFGFLSGWGSIAVGILLMLISGAVLKTLR